MDDLAREKANIPRPRKSQPLGGLDSYHRFVREASQREASNERPYTGHSRSFSIPRREPQHSNSPSNQSNALSHKSSNSSSSSSGSSLQKDEWPSVIRPEEDKASDRFAGVPPRLAPPIRSVESPTRPSTQKQEVQPETAVTLPWRPLYLHRRILASFAVLFAGLIGALVALLVTSNQNGGLGASAGSVYRYLWQWGPTAVFTLAAAMWSRVEYQAGASAPWLRMARGPPADADRTLLLDYVTSSQPRTVIAAFRNGDWLVCGVNVVGLHLRLLVVVATALVTLSSAASGDDLSVPTSLTLQTAFVNNATGLQNMGSLPYLTMLGLQTANLSFPDGVSKRFAYQTFRSGLPSDATVDVTTDGFVGALDCRTAQVGLTGIQGVQPASVQFNITLSAAGCTSTHKILSSNFLGATAQGNLTKLFLAFQPASCGNSTDIAQQRIAVMVGTVSLNITALPRGPGNVPISGSIPLSTALLCRPTYAIIPVNVMRNGTDLLSISPNGPTNRTLSNVNPWDLARAHFDSYSTGAATNSSSGYPDVGRLYNTSAILSVDAPMTAALTMRANELGVAPPLDSLQNPGTLGNLAIEYYQQYTALMARTGLMQGASTPVTGSAVRFNGGQRLVVRQLPISVMVAVLGTALAFCLVAVVALVPRRGFLPRDPNTIINVATLLAHSRPLLQCLRGTGAADRATIRDRLRDGRYSTGVEPYDKTSGTGLGYFRVFGGNPPSGDTPPEFVETADWGCPPPLHYAARLVSVGVMAAFIIVLEIVLRLSDERGGLVDVGDDTYLHLLWTAGPALLLTLLSVYLGAVDCVLRCLAPYAALKHGGSFADSVGLDLMDKSRFSIAHAAVRTRNFTVIVTSLAVLVGAHLAVVSGSLYSAVSISTAMNVSLQAFDYLGDSLAASTQDRPICAECKNDTVVASLILNSNLTFPAFTFQDLVFPSLRINGANVTADALVTVPVRIPSVRSSMTCRMYQGGDITTNLTLNGYTLGGLVNPLRINIAGEPCVLGNELQGSNAVISTAAGGVSRVKASTSPDAFFGIATTQTENAAQCSQFLYVWGQLAAANSNQTTVRNVVAMACNETMQTVETRVTLHGTDLDIDPRQPPTPVETNVINSTVAIPPLRYSDLANVSTTHLLDPFFSSLVASRWAIPVDRLGAPSADANATAEVSDAIVQQHKIVRAQTINARARRHLTPAGQYPLDGNGIAIADGVNPGAAPAAAQPTFSATALVADPTRPRRLVQDAVSTRILQALVGAVLALTLVGWLLAPGTRAILPRSPCSIASIAALLADGNVFGFLGRGAEWMSPAEIEAAFMDGSLHMGFKMGWEKVRRRRREEDRGLWGVGAGRNEERAFSISVARAGGWGGGEEVGLGIVARVGKGQRGFVRGWGRE